MTASKNEGPALALPPGEGAPGGPVLNPATPEDGGALAACMDACWVETFTGHLPPERVTGPEAPDFATLWHDWLGPPPAGPVFLARSGEAGPLLGFASGGPLRTPLDGWDGELLSLYLRRDAHGKGLGRALFDHVAGAMRDAGYKSLVARVLSGTPAVAFYEHLGGELITQHDGACYGCPVPLRFYGWRL